MQCAVRVRTLMEHLIYGEQVDSFDSLQDLLIKEHMIESYNPNLQMYLKDKNAKTVRDLAELVEHYYQVHKRYRYSKPLGMSGGSSGDNS